MSLSPNHPSNLDEPAHILVLSTFDGTNANVIRDFLFSFNAHSRHRYYYVFDCRTVDEQTNFSTFDVILVFWSVYLLGPDIPPAVRRHIRDSRAVKVLFLQDEYRDVYATNRAMLELGIQVMFTCVDDAHHETIYPRSLIPTLEAAYTVLPGYVPVYLEHTPFQDGTERPIDVGYRSREVPFYIGDLGREKRIIADRFTAICAEYGIRSDISIREGDRLYGRAWTDFLRSSRCVLGTASGASVVDFTGEIRRNCERYVGLHPEASYEEVRARFFADVDGRLVMETASPRVFEAAALGCTMVNHDGRYAGVLEPDRNYICVRRGYSNVADVIDRVRDRSFCREIARVAYADLVESGRYSYRAFAREFDARLAKHVRARRRSRTVSRSGFYARAYFRHRQAIVPRGGTYLVVPSYTLPFQVLRWALARLPSARRGPLLSRFVQNPQNFIAKGLAGWRIALGTACFRDLVRVYYGVRRRGSTIRAWQFIDDILKIDIARRARARTLQSRQPFRVELDLDRVSGVIRMTSAAGESDESGGPGRVDPAIEKALWGGGIHLLVWDHSAIAQDITYAIRPARWLHVGLGAGGVHRFEALSALYREAPTAVAAALIAVLRGERGGEAGPLAPGTPLGGIRHGKEMTGLGADS